MQCAHQIRLEIPSTAEFVGVVRQAVAGIAGRMCFSPTEVDDLKLAVGEACNNAVRHGCPSSVNPYITVVCNVAGDRLEIEISNGLAGGELCPTIVDDLDYSKEGGMGLYIMREIMDEVEIIWHDRTARVRMVKRLKRKKAR
ncbi:MAG: ATP-binding protein [Armatimonadetes bacterium]|nr:ATP-binding protein [Armatimonadota bacterium]